MSNLMGRETTERMSVTGLTSKTNNNTKMVSVVPSICNTAQTTKISKQAGLASHVFS